MTNLRTISIVKKNSPRKDSIDTWIAMTDPISGEVDPLRVSVSALNDTACEYNPEEGISFGELLQMGVEGRREQAIYFTSTGFFRFNDEFVGGAVVSGYEPGELYDKFLELGLRVSQQLDGQFRIRTLQKYDKVRVELRQNLLDYAVGASKERRNQRLDQILEWSASVPVEDQKTISSIVDQLKQQEIEVRESTRYNKFTLNEIVENTMNDGNDDLMKYFSKVNDGLKARFLRVVKYDQLTGKSGGIDSEFEFYGEVLTVMQSMDEEAAGLYLDNLHRLLFKDEHSDFMTWAFSVYSYIKGFSDQKRRVYFDTLSTTLKAGLKKYNVWIAIDAASLLEKHTHDQIKDIVQTLINENKGNERKISRD